MSQNSGRLNWSFDKVDASLKEIMINIYHNIDNAAQNTALRTTLLSALI